MRARVRLHVDQAVGDQRADVVPAHRRRRGSAIPVEALIAVDDGRRQEDGRGDPELAQDRRREVERVAVAVVEGDARARLVHGTGQELQRRVEAQDAKARPEQRLHVRPEGLGGDRQDVARVRDAVVGEDPDAWLLGRGPALRAGEPRPLPEVDRPVVGPGLQGRGPLAHAQPAIVATTERYHSRSRSRVSELLWHSRKSSPPCAAAAPGQRDDDLGALAVGEAHVL